MGRFEIPAYTYLKNPQLLRSATSRFESCNLQPASPAATALPTTIGSIFRFVSAAKNKLEYTLLLDADLNVTKQFGIAYKAPVAYDKLVPTSSEMTDREVEKAALTEMQKIPLAGLLF